MIGKREMMDKHVILLLGADADHAAVESILKYLSEQYQLKVEVLSFAQFDPVPEKRLYLLYFCDDEIKALFTKNLPPEIELGIIPNDHCRYAVLNYGIATDMYDAIDDVLNATEATPVDLLTCNTHPVIGNVVIGNVHGMNRISGDYSGYFKRVGAFFSDMMNLSFKSYTITTAKGNVTNTAATGIMIFEHNISGMSRNLLKEDLSFHDGRLHALVLAPASIIAYMYYLFLSHFRNRLLIENLPESVGLIASSDIVITSPTPIEYMAEGNAHTEEKVSFKVLRNAVKIYLGRNVSDVQRQMTPKEEKETVRVKGLPKAEMSKMLVSAPVSFLPKADEEDFKELFVSLRQSSKLSPAFIVLIVLSTLLATTGLFQSSTPVIIGAMILAPMMAPIISFSMGVLRGEKELLKESSMTLFFGIVTALIFSCLYTYLMPLNLLTDEMRSRLNPNILDLMVAVISGVAGAYAYAKSEVAKSLAGVAIAVALVPPLSVTGIGIGWGNWEVVYGSFLLFMTNLAGITLAASLTFLILGFSPVKRATRGIVVTSLLLVGITVPLFFSFFKVIEQNKIFQQLKTLEYVLLEDQKVGLRTLSVDLSRETPVIYIETRSTLILTNTQLTSIKQKVDEVLKRPVVVNILSEIELDQ